MSQRGYVVVAVAIPLSRLKPASLIKDILQSVSGHSDLKTT